MQATTNYAQCCQGVYTVTADDIELLCCFFYKALDDRKYVKLTAYNVFFNLF